MMNPSNRSKTEAIQEVSASAGALFFALACVLNAGLLVYVTLGHIG